MNERSEIFRSFPPLKTLKHPLKKKPNVQKLGAFSGNLRSAATGRDPAAIYRVFGRDLTAIARHGETLRYAIRVAVEGQTAPRIRYSSAIARYLHHW